MKYIYPAVFSPEDSGYSVEFPDTAIYRQTLSNVAVKKTLSIPQWLNRAAIANGINFSQVLQDALKQKLNML